MVKFYPLFYQLKLPQEIVDKLEAGDPNAVRWYEFHQANPHVYEKLHEIAVFLVHRGVTRIGIAFLFERLRWISKVESVGDPYTLNNTYRAFYARLLMWDDSSLAELFETRTSPHDPDYSEKVVNTWHQRQH